MLLGQSILNGEPHNGTGATFQGFERFFVVDARVTYRFDKKTRAAIGVDNLNNRKYYLFHPFPQRTLSAELRHAF